MTTPAGVIHDIGYKRYGGARHGYSTRWRVIMRNHLATAWKTWWRFKSPLMVAVITMFVAGGIMVFLKNELFEAGGDRRHLVATFVRTMSDAVLPESFPFFVRCAFIVSLTIGARTIAGDVKSGAFTFYFARSIRPRDYVLGKLAGSCVVVGLLMIPGPFVLAVTRLGLSRSTDELIELLPLIPKTLALGALATLVMAAVPLAFSALVRNPRYSLALWATYYFVIGYVMQGAGMGLHSSISALDIATSLAVVARELYDFRVPFTVTYWVPLHTALLSLAIHAVAAIAIIVYQVRRLHGSGVGGAS
ncbi:MAG: ABC transporter permease [Kofleriaceae bacterium]